MITCPNCNHQNPEGSLQCENCYTPLPATISCPNCGASVQTDATFCGQCGFNLQAENPPAAAEVEETAVGSLPDIPLEEVSLPDEIAVTGDIPDILPETTMSSPIQSPWDEEEEDMTIGQTKPVSNAIPEIEPTEVINASAPIPDLEAASASQPDNQPKINRPWELDSPDLELGSPVESPDLELESPLESPDLEDAEPTAVAPESKVEPEQFSFPPESAPVESESPKSSVPKPSFSPAGAMAGATQLQIQKASLLHLQTNTTIEITPNLDVVHIGKPNGQIPPDIDVAGFPDSEIVSRVHADLRIEGDAYYIEDIGSSNGTYVNHAPLLRGNRHRLRAGDRIALGKGDLVTFIFQLN